VKACFLNNHMYRDTCVIDFTEHSGEMDIAVEMDGEEIEGQTGETDGTIELYYGGVWHVFEDVDTEA